MQKIINFHVTKQNIKEHPIWPEIPDHPYRLLIIGGSEFGKTNSSLNLINHQPCIDKIYLYAKDPYEAKYQFLISKRESTGLKQFNNPKAFSEYSNGMDDTHKNIAEYNLKKKCKILIVFGDMITDMLSNKKLNPVLTKLFIRGRKLTISLVFLTQPCFAVPKNITLNSTLFYYENSKQTRTSITVINHTLTL